MGELGRHAYNLRDLSNWKVHLSPTHIFLCPTNTSEGRRRIRTERKAFRCKFKGSKKKKMTNPFLTERAGIWSLYAAWSTFVPILRVFPVLRLWHGETHLILHQVEYYCLWKKTGVVIEKNHAFDEARTDVRNI